MVLRFPLSPAASRMICPRLVPACCCTCTYGTIQVLRPCVNYHVYLICPYSRDTRPYHQPVGGNDSWRIACSIGDGSSSSQGQMNQYAAASSASFHAKGLQVRGTRLAGRPDDAVVDDGGPGKAQVALWTAGETQAESEPVPRKPGGAVSTDWSLWASYHQMITYSLVGPSQKPWTVNQSAWARIPPGREYVDEKGVSTGHTRKSTGEN